MLLLNPNDPSVPPSVAPATGAPSKMPAPSTMPPTKRKRADTPEIPVEIDPGFRLCEEKSLADYIDPVFLTDGPKKGDESDTTGQETLEAESPEQVAASNPPVSEDLLKRFDALLRPPEEEVLQLFPTNSYRPANYRWQLGVYLAKKVRLPRDFLEKAAFEARDFIRHFQTCKTNAYLLALEKKEPAKFGALMLYMADPPHPRWEVEARLLARESVEQIATKMRMAPDVIKMYEHWFFAVIDRLDHRSFIVHMVIREHAYAKKTDLEKIWKHYGYFAGPVVLDAIVHGTSPAHRPQQMSELAAFFAEDLHLTVMMKAMMSAYIMPVTQSGSPKILNLHYRLRKLELTSQVKNSLPENYSENIRIMMEFLPGMNRRGNEKNDEFVGKPPPGLK